MGDDLDGAGPLAAEAAAGLAARLKTLVLALDRRDRLETAQAFVGWLAAERRDGRLEGDALELLLRALKVASDPASFDLLRRLDVVDAATVPELMAATGLERVAVSERLHDMAQTGLASLEMVGDQVRATELARGLAGWLLEVAAAAAARVEDELPAPGGGGRRDG